VAYFEELPHPLRCETEGNHHSWNVSVKMFLET